MTRRERKSGRRQVQREAAEMFRRYNEARAVAAEAVRMDYRNQGTAAKPFFKAELRNPLGRQIIETGTQIHNQTRANGKKLADLPRYTQ